MKSQIVFIIGVIFVCVNAKPAGEEPQSKIINYDSDVREDGYSFSFETSDPIKRSERGQFTPGTAAQGRSLDGAEEPTGTLKVDGDFGFNFPDGVPYYVTFVADENGYRPKVSFGTNTGPQAGNRP